MQAGVYDSSVKNQKLRYSGHCHWWHLASISARRVTALEFLGPVHTYHAEVDNNWSHEFYKYVITQQGVRVDPLLNQIPEPALSEELIVALTEWQGRKIHCLLPHISKNSGWQPWWRSGTAGKLLKTREPQAPPLGWRGNSDKKPMLDPLLYGQMGEQAKIYGINI